MRLQAGQHGAARALALRLRQQRDVDHAQRLFGGVDDQPADRRAVAFDHQVARLRIGLAIALVVHALLHGDQLVDEVGFGLHLQQIAAAAAVQHAHESLVACAVGIELAQVERRG